MSDDAEAAKELAAEEAAIEMFKVKKLIKSLERAKGCVSCLICSHMGPGTRTPPPPLSTCTAHLTPPLILCYHSSCSLSLSLPVFPGATQERHVYDLPGAAPQVPDFLDQQDVDG